MNTEKLTLYIRSNGQLREWSIRAEDGDIIIEYGVYGGQLIVKTEEVTEGLANRTLEEQINSRMGSRISKQIDKGYKYNKDDLNEKPLNRLGFFKPMLARPIKVVPKINFSNAFIQYKYDGHRCLITKQKGNMFAYTRNGKIIGSIGHILEQINIENGQTLDGELYCHGMTLQKISSLVKRQQADTGKIKYHLYDIISKLPYDQRLNILSDMRTQYVIPVPTHRVNSHDEIQEHFEHARDEGYEGSIVRWGNDGYKDGKRTNHLVKIKKSFDAECLVVGIKPSADGWARLECVFDSKMFMVSAPGNMDQKYDTYHNRIDYIGHYVNVEYANITRDGVPFHPIATKWMNDVSI